MAQSEGSADRRDRSDGGRAPSASVPVVLVSEVVATSPAGVAATAEVAVLERLAALSAQVVEEYRGSVVRRDEPLAAAFSDASAAVRAAAEIQRRLVRLQRDGEWRGACLRVAVAANPVGGGPAGPETGSRACRSRERPGSRGPGAHLAVGPGSDRRRCGHPLRLGRRVRIGSGRTQGGDLRGALEQRPGDSRRDPRHAHPRAGTSGDERYREGGPRGLGDARPRHAPSLPGFGRGRKPHLAVRDPRAARQGRHGRRLQGPRPRDGRDRRAQIPPTRDRRPTRDHGAVQERSPAGPPDHPQERLPHPRVRAPRRHRLHLDGVRRRRDAARTSSRASGA